MKSKAYINYWIDVVIGIAFLLSIVSGLVLLFAPSGGYQGGRNAGYGRTVLLLGHQTWNDLHTWSSIVMAAGVLGHLLLHWNWLICMTKKLFRRKRKTISTVAACPNPTV
jgi:hypothetical protein